MRTPLVKCTSETTTRLVRRAHCKSTPKLLPDVRITSWRGAVGQSEAGPGPTLKLRSIGLSAKEDDARRRLNPNRGRWILGKNKKI